MSRYRAELLESKTITRMGDKTLESIGQRSINNMVDAANLLCLIVDSQHIFSI